MHCSVIELEVICKNFFKFGIIFLFCHLKPNAVCKSEYESDFLFSCHLNFISAKMVIIILVCAEEYQSQIGEAQTLLGEKTAALERENFRLRRVQEEVAALRRRLERAQRMELAGTADEVLQEEVREYKEQLTCPSCKVSITSQFPTSSA